MLPIDLMARPLRIEYPGAIYRVTVRGNARLVRGHECLLKLTRYVHMNPVQKEPCAP
ncbi:MAG: hypothetical protein GX608_01935 [Lentisphaerae bacterium]|nr:hypothetical protein [Lentisphaerota bacterium]